LQKQGYDASNLKKYINTSIDVAQNVSKYWHNGDIDIKKRIQKLVFPKGLVLDIQKREYLTTKVNSVFSLIDGLSGVTEGRKKDDSMKNIESSYPVAGILFQPYFKGNH
jgi:site-specific DNA recombinase